MFKKTSNKIYDEKTIKQQKLSEALNIYNKKFRDNYIKFFKKTNDPNILSLYVLAYIEPKKLKLFGLWDPNHWNIYCYDDAEGFCKFLESLYTLSYHYSEDDASYVNNFFKKEFQTFIYFPIYEFETDFDVEILLDSLAYSIACKKELISGGTCILPKGHVGNHFSSNILKEIDS